MHTKRLAAPRALKISRKEAKFVVTPRPGPHKKDRCIPLQILVKDYLGYARTSKEAKKIIKSGKILIDKKVRKDLKFPVGLFDIVEIPETGDTKIVLLDRKGRLILKDIDKEAAKYKFCRIMNKTVVKGGHIQLNLHDGRNYLVRVKDPTNPKEDVYKTKDTVVLNLETGEIVNHFRYKEGSYVYIIGGSNVSKVARIENIRIVRSPLPNLVTLRENGRTFETIEDYVFVIGEDKIMLPALAESTVLASEIEQKEGGEEEGDE